MPYKYQRKKEPVDKEKLAECLVIIATGASVLGAASALGLPRTTVNRHFLAQQSGQLIRATAGMPPSLHPTLSAEISVVAKTAASTGFGLSKTDLIIFVSDVVKARLEVEDDIGKYLRQHCRFPHGIPSHDFIENFMRDNHLSLVKPAPLERARAQAQADPFLIYEFYQLVDEEMARLGIHNQPKHIFNLDESAFFLDPSRGKVVAETGGGSVHRNVAGSGRTAFSVMACICADGSAQPPLIIFPGGFTIILYIMVNTFVNFNELTNEQLTEVNVLFI
jgi:hypothetical protein